MKGAPRREQCKRCDDLIVLGRDQPRPRVERCLLRIERLKRGTLSDLRLFADALATATAAASTCALEDLITAGVIANSRQAEATPARPFVIKLS
jgi:hypothetical protein